MYDEPENAWYEWRIIDGGRTLRDTGTEGCSAFQGCQYGQAEIALCDALMFASGLPIDGDSTARELRALQDAQQAYPQAQAQVVVLRPPPAPLLSQWPVDIQMKPAAQCLLNEKPDLTGQMHAGPLAMLRRLCGVWAPARYCAISPRQHPPCTWF